VIVTGKTLIDWGLKPGQWFADAIKAANVALANGGDERAARAEAARFAPAPPTRLRAPGALGYAVNLTPEDADEADNLAKVEAHMAELMRVPTIVAGAIMPDAWPRGPSARHDSGRRDRCGQRGDPSGDALGRHLLLDGCDGFRTRRRPDRDPRRRHEAFALRRRRTDLQLR
jgi:hypothetical protein